MIVTLGAPNAAFKGFATPAFDARLARGGDSLVLSVLVYPDREAIRGDWDLPVGKSPVPKDGRALPEHISTWWNENVVVVVRASVGDMASDALDAFLSLGEPIAASQPRLVFIRQPDRVFPLDGVLWMANPDGTGQRQMTPDGVQATFASLIWERNSGNLMFYYVTRDGETSRTFWHLNVDSGERSSVFTFEAYGAGASVSPGGRYVAFTDIGGISLLDLATGERQRLLTSGDRDACLGGDIRECMVYGSPAWSPEGRLLLVAKGFWEGGTAVVVDPFQDPPLELIAASLGDQLPTSAEWSPGGDAVCAWGRYGGYSGLYLARKPDWEPLNLLSEYEDYTVNPEGRTVVDCGWLDAATVAFLTIRELPFTEGELMAFDAATGEPARIALLPDATHCCTGSLSIVPGGQALITQFIVLTDGGDPVYWTQPKLIDLDSGIEQAILQPRDFVVAVVRP